MTAPSITAALALPLIQNRAERLASELRDGAPIAGSTIAAALEGIAVDLADVVAQMARPAVTL